MCLGVLLNLFEEIEFFKELNQTIALPLLLSLNFELRLSLVILLLFKTISPKRL